MLSFSKFGLSSEEEDYQGSINVHVSSSEYTNSSNKSLLPSSSSSVTFAQRKKFCSGKSLKQSVYVNKKSNICDENKNLVDDIVKKQASDREKCVDDEDKNKFNYLRRHRITVEEKNDRKFNVEGEKDKRIREARELYKGKEKDYLAKTTVDFNVEKNDDYTNYELMKKTNEKYYKVKSNLNDKGQKIKHKDFTKYRSKEDNRHGSNETKMFKDKIDFDFEEKKCDNENNIKHTFRNPYKDEKIIDEKASIDYEDNMTIFDRMWYDRDEGFDLILGDYEESNLKRLQQKEEKMKIQQSYAKCHGRKMGPREDARRIDNEMWEMNRLHRSGIAMKKEEVNLDFDEDEDFKEHVIVKDNIKPPFLSGNVKYTTQLDLIPPVKDPTADMAIIARRGSAALRRLKEDEDRRSLRDRFWEVTGSKLGDLIGVENEKQNKIENEAFQTENDFDFKQDLQYSSIIKKQKACVKSDFSKKNTIQQQRQSLPVFECRDELLSLIRQHQVIIVVGETGSGKTTQLTQYLAEEKYTLFGIIGCTQPRRVAAVSVAKRVADEMGVVLGEEVGYAIRFEDCTNENTIIKYMTDGVLTRESLNESDLDKYSVIIMDEAHERSLNTDVLFGILKGVISRRLDIRLIVTSATMDAEKFSTFFGGAPVYHILGRTFPVTIEFSRSPCEDYIDAAVQKCLQIHCVGNEGDILIFMTGKDDIEGCCVLLAERLMQLGNKVPPLSILPIYSQLPSDLQAKIFEESEYRKVVVATNIAETSLTIDGIRYVIDSGYSKLKVYNPKIGMDSLQVIPISQANANQRAGRAGRTGAGVCYRLYTERAFISEMYENTIPEIQRTNLANVILLLKSLGIKNMLQFDFMDAPPQDTILNALFQLWLLNAIDNLGDITNSGKKIVQFPLDPPLGKILVNSVDLHASEETLIIVSMLSITNVFYIPKEKIEEAEAAKEKFYVPESDHLTLLNVYLQWKTNGFRDSWCTQHYIQPKSMKKAREVRSQLLDIMEQQKMKCESCGDDWDIVRQVICSGYFTNAAKLRGIGEYVNLRTSLNCHLHPNSALYGAGYTPDYVVYHEVVLTAKEYMRNVTAVEAKWLAKFGPMFFALKQTGGDTNSSSNIKENCDEDERAFQKKMEEDIRKKEIEDEKSKTNQHNTCKIAKIGVRRKFRTK